jgi:HSP20 family protein
MTGGNRLSAFLNQFNDFGREFDRVLERWAGEAGRQFAGTAAFPLVNVREENEAFHVEAELPGLAQDQLNVEVSHRTQVTISGELKPVGQEGQWHRKERPSGRFERTLTFPAPIDAEKVEARLENGVLHLTLPKAEEARPRKITVTAR